MKSKVLEPFNYSIVGYYLLPTCDLKSIGHYIVLSWVMKNNRN